MPVVPEEEAGTKEEISAALKTITVYDLRLAVQMQTVQALVLLITNSDELAYTRLFERIRANEDAALETSLQQLLSAEKLCDTVIKLVTLAFWETKFALKRKSLLTSMVESDKVEFADVGTDVIMTRQRKSKPDKQNRLKAATGKLFRSFFTLSRTSDSCVAECLNVNTTTKEEMVTHWETILTTPVFEARATVLADALVQLCAECGVAVAIQPGSSPFAGFSTILDTTRIILDLVALIPRSASRPQWMNVLEAPNKRWPAALPSAVPSDADTELVPGFFQQDTRRKRARTSRTALSPSLTKAFSELTTPSVWTPQQNLPGHGLFSPQTDFTFDPTLVDEAWVQGVNALSGHEIDTDGNMGCIPRTDVPNDNQQLVFHGTDKPLCANGKLGRCVATLYKGAPGPLPPFQTAPEEELWKKTGKFSNPDGLCLLCMRQQWQTSVLFFNGVQNPLQQNMPRLNPPVCVTQNEPGGYNSEYIVQHPLAGAAFPGLSDQCEVVYATDTNTYYVDQGRMIYNPTDSNLN